MVKTGFYVRIPRNSIIVTIDITECTDAEIDYLTSKMPDVGWAWVKGLVHWIRDNVKEEGEHNG